MFDVLSGCGLLRADLTHATLTDVTLIEADLIHASLEGADFSNPDLSGAVVQRDQLTTATLDGTTLPNFDDESSTSTGDDVLATASKNY